MLDESYLARSCRGRIRSLVLPGTDGRFANCFTVLCVACIGPEGMRLDYDDSEDKKSERFRLSLGFNAPVRRLSLSRVSHTFQSPRFRRVSTYASGPRLRAISRSRYRHGLLMLPRDFRQPFLRFGRKKVWEEITTLLVEFISGWANITTGGGAVLPVVLPYPTHQTSIPSSEVHRFAQVRFKIAKQPALT